MRNLYGRRHLDWRHSTRYLDDALQEMHWQSGIELTPVATVTLSTPCPHPPHNGRHSAWQHDTLFKMCKSGSTKAIPKWRVTLWVTPWHDNQSSNNPCSKVIGAQTRGWKMFFLPNYYNDVRWRHQDAKSFSGSFFELQVAANGSFPENLRQWVNLSWDYAFRDSVPNFCELAIAWDWSELPRPTTGKKGGETKGLPPQQLWLWWVCTYLSKIKIISMILTFLNYLHSRSLAIPKNSTSQFFLELWFVKTCFLMVLVLFEKTTHFTFP